MTFLLKATKTHLKISRWAFWSRTFRDINDKKVTRDIALHANLANSRLDS